MQRHRLNPADVTGAVLAGGRGRRMGGVDKGWVEMGGRPLVAHVLQALRPQVGTVLISANRNQARYAACGHAVVADEIQDYAGPLAGIASAMAAASTPWLLVVPCDGPCLPPDLAVRLYAARADAEIAAAYDGQRLQPLFALLDIRLLRDLRHWLDSGGRGVESWYANHRLARVDFSDKPAAFVNLNDPEQCAQMDRDYRKVTG